MLIGSTAPSLRDLFNPAQPFRRGEELFKVSGVEIHAIHRHPAGSTQWCFLHRLDHAAGQPPCGDCSASGLLLEGFRAATQPAGVAADAVAWWAAVPSGWHGDATHRSVEYERSRVVASRCHGPALTANQTTPGTDHLPLLPSNCGNSATNCSATGALVANCRSLCCSRIQPPSPPSLNGPVHGN